MPKIKTIEEKRKDFNLQHFLEDMMLLREQTRNPRLKKPADNTPGDSSTTNYLLWLILAELMELNNKIEIKR